LNAISAIKKTESLCSWNMSQKLSITQGRCKGSIAARSCASSLYNDKPLVNHGFLTARCHGGSSSQKCRAFSNEQHCELFPRLRTGEWLERPRPPGPDSSSRLHENSNRDCQRFRICRRMPWTALLKIFLSRFHRRTTVALHIRAGRRVYLARSRVRSVVHIMPWPLKHILRLSKLLLGSSRLRVSSFSSTSIQIQAEHRYDCEPF
jgi:hypothetical protein